MLKKRTAGILLHLSALPSADGIGDMGPPARRFADFLQAAGLHVWQILPLTITMGLQGFSPYSCFSAFAGNPLFISLDELAADGLLTKEELSERPAFATERVEYAKCRRYKQRRFKTAFERFRKNRNRPDYQRFMATEAGWLTDFALFMALKEHFGGKPWSAWPAAIKRRDRDAMAAAGDRLRESVDYHQFLQYLFARQYAALKAYCHQKGIQIFGDLPIYVTHDSADVWAAPEAFKLTRSGRPQFIAGVPPDYFSKTGQLWGNPVYDWDRQAEDGYAWWMRRLGHNFQLYDMVRIDHFRGFEAFWQVPASHSTAVGGRWVPGPGEAFFRTLLDYYPQPPIVAEDLGEITPAVRELIGMFELPTMKVLQFSFDGDAVGNPHLPHNHPANALVYTGTHDNNTTRGWYRKDATAAEKKRLAEYLGKRVSATSVARDLMRLAMASVARLAVIPMQDVLGLDETARMNNPATRRRNWTWRMKPGALTAATEKRLRNLAEQYGRQ